VQKSVKRLKELDEMATDGRYELLPKKEVTKLERERKPPAANLAVIKNMRPGCRMRCLVIDSNKSRSRCARRASWAFPWSPWLTPIAIPGEVDY